MHNHVANSMRVCSRCSVIFYICARGARGPSCSAQHWQGHAAGACTNADACASVGVASCTREGTGDSMRTSLCTVVPTGTRAHSVRRMRCKRQYPLVHMSSTRWYTLRRMRCKRRYPLVHMSSACAWFYPRKRASRCLWRCMRLARRSYSFKSKFFSDAHFSSSLASSFSRKFSHVNSWRVTRK